MSDPNYLAIQIIARVPAGMTFEESKALTERVLAALGCTGEEPDCPMEMYASTVVSDPEVAYNWLH